MTRAAPRIYELIARRGGDVLTLALSADAGTANVLRPGATPSEGGRARVPTRSQVRVGDRVDAEMRLPSAQVVVASGVITRLDVLEGTTLPVAEIVFVRSHSLRIRAMLEAVGTSRQLEPTVVEDVMRLRVRGNAALLSALEPASGRGGGRIELPWRRGLNLDQRVLVEVGLGAMADEIMLVGTVVGRSTGRDGSPGGGGVRAVVEIAPAHAARVRYVTEVLRGQRSPTTRAYRRLPLRRVGRWWIGARLEAQVFDDVSRSGLFVSTPAPPPVGTRVNVEFSDIRFGRMRFDTDVRWVSQDPQRLGFGAQFRLTDQTAVSRLSDLLDVEAATTPAWA